MEIWFLYIFLFSIGFAIGVFYMARRVGLIKKQDYKLGKELGYASKLKLQAVLLILGFVAIAGWALYGFSTSKGSTILTDKWVVLQRISEAVVGISLASLLGGIVFEYYLRRDILAETSKTLAEIVTTNKEITKEVFPKHKRNKIIETMLQLNTENDIYGSGLYHDFLAQYTETDLSSNREFRFDFEDSIALSDIDPIRYAELAKNYLEVVDRIRYRTYRSEYESYEELLVGLARGLPELDVFFSDATCMYRWLLQLSNFDEMITKYKDIVFGIKLKINGKQCMLKNEGSITARGFEIRFDNPLKKSNTQLSPKADELVEIEIEIHTVQPKKSNFVSVHLAYPVKGAEISLFYENARSISDVTYVHFTTRGKNKPRFYDPPPDLRLGKGKSQRFKTVKISNDHWLFPDSGVIFVW